MGKTSDSLEWSRAANASAKWATFGKQNWRCGMNQTFRLKRYTLTLMRYHERCWLIQTAGRWPWKSESAKECVTTHLPNELALKMDGAQACYPYSAAGAETMPQRVGRRGGL